MVVQILVSVVIVIETGVCFVFYLRCKKCFTKTNSNLLNWCYKSSEPWVEEDAGIGSEKGNGPVTSERMPCELDPWKWPLIPLTKALKDVLRLLPVTRTSWGQIARASELWSGAKKANHPSSQNSGKSILKVSVVLAPGCLHGNLEARGVCFSEGGECFV